MLSLAFGVFFDYDLDGRPDILAANGHIEEEIGRVQPRVQFRQPPLLFHNLGSKRFEDVTASAGPAFNRPIVARGAAHADYDHDGDLDVVLTTNHGPAYLFRNDGGNANRWLAVTVKGSGAVSNRDGIGAIVRVKTAAGQQWQMVRSGSSYASQSDLTLTCWQRGQRRRRGRVATRGRVAPPCREGGSTDRHQGRRWRRWRPLKIVN
ncbi:MAG: VCBS repeat-containing protein [Vicinamibacterales bacterium]